MKIISATPGLMKTGVQMGCFRVGLLYVCTSKVIRIAGRKYVLITINTFSTSSKVLVVDSNNGYSLDNTQEIADQFHGDKEGINEYFDKKKESINLSHRNDSNTGAISGIDANELSKWLDYKKDLLLQLEDQKDDVLDLASIPVSEDEAETESLSDELSNDNSNNNEENNDSSHGSPKPQDSSEVEETDFNSFEPFDE